jgi:hypothetical protein
VNRSPASGYRRERYTDVRNEQRVRNDEEGIMVRQYDNNPDLPTPEQRRRDIAAILAAGILRLRARAALTSAKSLEKPENSAANCLEVSAKTVLSGHRG